MVVLDLNLIPRLQNVNITLGGGAWNLFSFGCDKTARIFTGRKEMGLNCMWAYLGEGGELRTAKIAEVPSNSLCMYIYLLRGLCRASLFV